MLYKLFLNFIITVTRHDWRNYTGENLNESKNVYGSYILTFER